MELGIIAQPNEESFKKAHKKGLAFLEFCLNINYDLNSYFNDIDNILSWIKTYNVGVGSIGRWGTDRIDQTGSIIDKELQISYKLIDSAEILGCSNFVCGCNYIDSLSFYENCTAAINYFSKLIDYAKDKNVKISTYNCRWNNFVHSDPTWEIIHGYLKDLGIKYDPSHCIYAKGDYLNEMKKWGKRFYHIHLKGSLVIDNERYDDPPAGLDMTNWGVFLSILYAQKYEGLLSIEPHSPNWSGELGEKGVDFTIKYMNDLLL